MFRSQLPNHLEVARVIIQMLSVPSTRDTAMRPAQTITFPTIPNLPLSAVGTITMTAHSSSGPGCQLRRHRPGKRLRKQGNSNGDGGAGNDNRLASRQCDVCARGCGLSRRHDESLLTAAWTLTVDDGVGA